MEIFFGAICGFVVGVIFSVLMAGSFLTSEDNDVEKRGVWANEGRAYRLTPIEPLLPSK